MVRDDLSSVGCRGPKLAWVVPRHSCMGGFLKKILESSQTIMIRWYGRKAEKLSPDGFPFYTPKVRTMDDPGLWFSRKIPRSALDDRGTESA